jgi:hypothetical protein
MGQTTTTVHLESDAHKGAGLFSEAQRSLKSDRAVAAHLPGGHLRNNGHSRAKSGKREDIGIYVRSSWEANIARYLNWMKSIGAIFAWEYEADTFWFLNFKRGTRSYTPDFKIWDRAGDTPYYWEVKGWMDQKSQTKLSRMAKYYPDVKVIVIGSAEYKAIRNQARRVVPGWEGRAA